MIAALKNVIQWLILIAFVFLISVCAGYMVGFLVNGKPFESLGYVVLAWVLSVMLTRIMDVFE